MFRSGTAGVGGRGLRPNSLYRAQADGNRLPFPLRGR